MSKFANITEAEAIELGFEKIDTKINDDSVVRTYQLNNFMIVFVYSLKLQNSSFTTDTIKSLQLADKLKHFLKPQIVWTK
jgi:hypothetical protein